MQKWLRFLAPFGMVSAICYGLMIVLGQALWKEYDPVSSFVSYLTADGAPNARAMQTLNTFHSLFLLLFTLGMYKRALGQYHMVTKRGYGMLLAVATVTLIGFSQCPINAAEVFTSVRNMTHFILTLVIIVATIIAMTMLGIGYMKHEGLKVLGRAIFYADGLICTFGAAALLCMRVQPGIVGLAQRLLLFSLEGFIFFLSYVHTFRCGMRVIPV